MKKKQLTLLDTGVNSAKINMRLDEELLLSLDPYGEPLLHLYEWAGKAITYGYFIDPGKLFNFTAIREEQFSLARRPTGGGVVFHLWDYAFSFLMPAGHPLCFSTPLENYRFVNQGVLEAIRPLLPCCSAAGLFPSIQTDVFCMARPTIYDLILDGKKIAGAAQRRRKNGYLHQGTISLVAPEPILLQKLVSKEIAELMIICSCSLTELPQLAHIRAQVKRGLIETFTKILEEYDAQSCADTNNR